MSLVGEAITVATCQVRTFGRIQQGLLAGFGLSRTTPRPKRASLVCFPERFLQGYLTDPVLARRHAIGLESEAVASTLATLATLAPIAPILVFGLIESDAGRLYNTAVVVEHGQLRGRYRKREILKGERVFDRGEESPVFNAAGLPFGINICADTRVAGHAAAVARKGARLVLRPANNMLPRDTAEAWKNRHHGCRADRARENWVWLISSDVAYSGPSSGRRSWTRPPASWSRSNSLSACSVPAG